jgi:Tol biopolymer transport system component/DNA-binding winged helix-turn-helix (wHTH) protein
MLFSFDDYTLDSEARTLRHGDVTVPLTPKVFKTLLVLIENHDRVMSKNELLESIWPEQFVEEANLTQNISVLRRALGEAARGKKYIATFPGHGYRFLEPVCIARDPGYEWTQGVWGNGTNGDPGGHPDGHQGVASTDGSSHTVEQPQPAIEPRRQLYRYLKYSAAALLCLTLGIVIASIVISRRRGGPQRSMEQSSGAERAIGRPAELRTLTRLDGAQYEPTWSRDGKHLAFVYSSLNDPHSAIYIQSEGEFQPRRVASGPGEYVSPVWSPDGKSLAYLHLQPNMAEIDVLDAAQSTWKRLTTLFPHRYGLNCRHLDWSPDGKLLVVDDKNTETDPLSLYLVYVSNGNKTRLTYPTMDIIGDVSPRFSPDGAQVAFIRMKYQYEYDVFVLPVTGGEARRLTERSSVLGDVDWETNDSLIFSGRRDDEFRFWRLSLRSPQPRPVLASSVETDVPLQFSISYQTRQVAFSAFRPDLNIWALDLRKNPHLRADWTPVIRTPGQDIAPSFSPDGKKISFRSDVSGEIQLWISRSDGSDAFPVDTGSKVPSVDSWAPDGQAIICSLQSFSGIYEVSPSHKFPLRTITSLHVTHPFYSVDGKWIFARTGNFIYRFRATGGALEQLTNQGGGPIRESKDGRYLYFGQGRMDTTISRLDLATKHQEVVVHSLMAGYGDSWALASRGIFFLTAQSGKPMIAFHDFATGKKRDITEFPGPLPPVGTSGFSISPDDSRLLVVRADPAFANIQATVLASASKQN